MLKYFVLSWDRAYSRESVLEFKNTDINDLLQMVLSLTRHKLELSDIKLETSLCLDPLIVYGDKNQLQQCFLNLIFNAIDAMPKGGKMSISSGIKKDQKQVWIKINDNGCGISEQDMEHIFDPFFTTKEVGKGTGLGLSVCYGIIKRHGGDIDVKSTVGKGTEVCVTIPVRQPSKGELSHP